MGWATNYIEKLSKGEIVVFRPRGNSMSGRVENGQLCKVIPRLDRMPEKGDVVLCKVNGREYLHIVKAVNKGQVKIGNNKGGINGWTHISNIFGYLDESFTEGETEENVYKFKLTPLFLGEEKFFDENNAPDWLKFGGRKGSTMCNRWFWNDYIMKMEVGDVLKMDWNTIERLPD